MEMLLLNNKLGKLPELNEYIDHIYNKYEILISHLDKEVCKKLIQLFLTEDLTEPVYPILLEAGVLFYTIEKKYPTKVEALKFIKNTFNLHYNYDNYNSEIILNLIHVYYAPKILRIKKRNIYYHVNMHFILQIVLDQMFLIGLKKTYVVLFADKIFEM